ncbi:MAG: CDP-glycerol glycerophosphotransferase family protein [Parachlamydiaceae bacterium]|nr:CDP-glycerol glycerophosphotransferase family protein [Parachlamydiaceae bacterium]
MIEKKGVGLNPLSQIHYTDHLAVVCIIMGIPLLFLDEADYALGLKCYPELQADLQAYNQFNPEFLITNYDVLFMSDLWDKRTFHEKYGPLEKKHNKVLRHVHCPHGFSDKGFYLKKCANEDITLIYGQNMLDLLKHHGVFENLNQYVITGNYRLSYFNQHRAFYNELVSKEVFSRFAKKQPVILYAPTWMDLEDSTSFFEVYAYLLDNLPAEYNMIVKLHPRLELDDTALYYHIIGKYEQHPNIIFLKDFPLVYPLLAHSDIYIGDMSSVGYDFLTFNKPMFFLNQQKRDVKMDRGLYLFRCGTEIKPDAYPLIYRFLEANLPTDQERFSHIRKEVYDYTFGPERSFAEIKADIVKAYT